MFFSPNLTLAVSCFFSIPYPIGTYYVNSPPFPISPSPPPPHASSLSPVPPPPATRPLPSPSPTGHSHVTADLCHGEQGERATSIRRRGTLDVAQESFDHLLRDSAVRQTHGRHALGDGRVRLWRGGEGRGDSAVRQTHGRHTLGDGRVRLWREGEGRPAVRHTAATHWELNEYACGGEGRGGEASVTS